MKNKQKSINRKAYRLISLVAMMFIITLFSCNLVAGALTIDTITNYDKTYLGYPEITLKDWFGLPLISEEIFKGTIEEHTTSCSSDCSSTIKVLVKEGLPYYDYLRTDRILEDGTRVEDVEIYSKKVEKKIGTQIIDKPIQSFVCDVIGFDSKNNSDITKCAWEDTGIEKIESPIYEEINPNTLSDGKEVELKITGDKKSSWEIDWVLISQGEELIDWATWGESGKDVGLKAYYKFDENGGIQSSDSLGVYNLTGFNNPRWVTGGKINSATNLSFIDGHTWWNSTFTQVGNNEITIAGWYWWAGIGGNNNYAWTIGGSVSGAMAILREASPGNVIQFSDRATAPTTIGSITGKTWAHIAMVYNKTGFNFYLNGVNTVNRTLTITLDTANLKIGRDQASAIYSEWSGYLDEIGVWNRTLSASEISQLYNGGNGASYPYSGASITLNSPPNLNISVSRTNSFNISATPTAPATLVNISLWTNKSGIWQIDNVTTTSGKFMTLNFPTNGNYLWGASACDSDGDCSASSVNYTININKAKPIVDLVSPVNGYQTIINAVSLVANASSFGGATLVNISLWTNNTNWVINETKSLTGVDDSETFSKSFPLGSYLWSGSACDSDGDCGVSGNRTISIKSVIEDNRTYSTSTFETAREQFILNVSTAPSILSLSGSLVYNGTTYPSTIANIGTNTYSLTNFIDVGLVNADAINKNLYWTITSFDGSTSITTTTATYQQPVNKTHLAVCNATYTQQAVNFTAKDEESYAKVYNWSLAGSLNYWLGTGTQYKTMSFSNTSILDNLALCISPVYKNFNISGTLEYENNTGSITREYYFDGDMINNVTTNITLFMFGSEEATTFIIYVIDISQKPVADAVVEVQRYYPAINDWQTVQVVKTNDDGKTIGFYKTETALYRHKIYTNGELQLQTSGSKVFAESAPYTLTFTIGENPDIPWRELVELDDLTASVSYANNTKIASYTYIDTSTDFSQGRFAVWKVNYNQSNALICNTTSALASAIITCPISARNGTFIMEGYITRSGIEYLVATDSFTTSDAKGVFEKEGLFLAWFIILVASFIFIINPIAGIWAVTLAVLFVNLVGLATFGWVYVAGLIFLAIIATVILKPSGGGYV